MAPVVSSANIYLRKMLTRADFWDDVIPYASINFCSSSDIELSPKDDSEVDVEDEEREAVEKDARRPLELPIAGRSVVAINPLSLFHCLEIKELGISDEAASERSVTLDLEG